MAQRVVFGPFPPPASSGLQPPDSPDCCASESPTTPRFEVPPSLPAASGSLVRRQNLSPSSSTSPSSPDGTGSLRIEGLSLVIVKAEPESPRVLTVGLGMVPVQPSTASPLASPTDGATTAVPVAVAKRPRGRPRKHPKPDPEESKTKSAPKARSKTGCRTCRRRKKKCDETKPMCMCTFVLRAWLTSPGISCEKNNVECEGYPIKTIWRSGKQKTIYRRKLRRRMALPADQPAHNKYVQSGPAELPNLIQCVESQLDWEFFDHFNKTLCRVLTVNRDKNNPFQGMLPSGHVQR
jgi:hypothetical protein